MAVFWNERSARLERGKFFHWALDLTFTRARVIGKGDASGGLSGMRRLAIGFLAPLRARPGASFERNIEVISGAPSNLEEAPEKTSTRSGRRIDGEYRVIGQNRAKHP